MATVYYGEGKSSSEQRERTQGVLTYSTSQTATTFTFTAASQLQIRNYYHAGYRLNTIVNGTTVATTIGYADEVYYAFTPVLNTDTYSPSEPYVKTHSSQTITIKSEYYGEACDIYLPGPMDGECTVTITIPPKESYSVIYNANGGTGAPQSQVKWHDESLTLRSGIPARTNYTFLGWSTSQAATSVTYAPGETYSLNAAVTLYAVWQASGGYIRTNRQTTVRLFESTDTSFATNGLGLLSDATYCVVTEHRNGEYELEMEYPITGINYNLIEFRRLIVVKPNPYSEFQAFRIYAISKPMNGIVTINASHISYDLSGYSVSPFSANSITEAFSKLKSKSVTECPFEFWTDKSSTTAFSVTKPSSIRSVLGGTEGSILDTYQGEFEFDNFSVYLYNSRGMNRGASIRYGKNLTDLKQDENCDNVYTAIYPYWYSDQDGLIELPGKLVTVEGEYNYTRILPVDLTEFFEEPPTAEQLLEIANVYISEHNIGVPEVSLTVSFVQLSESEEYKTYSLLEDVRLCDTVSVEFPELKVSAAAQCTATKYNVLTGKYVSIDLGTAQNTLATTIVSQGNAIQDSSDKTKTYLERAIITATNLITGHSGGYVVINPANNPSEILILDKPVLEEATSVWRWNSGGLGYSSNGYNGPYDIAITMDGAINANFITAGVINGNLIRTGLIESINNGFYLDIDNGTFYFGDHRISYDGSNLNIAADTITMGGSPLTTSSEVQSSIASSEQSTNASIADLRDALDSFETDFNGFITIKPDEPSITLGRINAQSNVKITDSTMVLTGSGNARAELGDSSFTVDQINTSNVTLGNSAWEIRSNGHVSLKRVK